MLTELLTRIMRQESRHVALHATQARERLARTRKAQRMTRFALRAFWAPVGSGVMPEAETRRLLRFLLSGPEGAKIVGQIDEKVHRLPGLENLHLARRTATKHGIGEQRVNDRLIDRDLYWASWS